jgi:hypothetical protein
MKAHACERRKWARVYLHWNVENWRGVFFTDESIMKRDSSPSVTWFLDVKQKRENMPSKNTTKAKARRCIGNVMGSLYQR